MVEADKIVNDYIIRANKNVLSGDQLALAKALDGLADKLTDGHVDAADLIHDQRPGAYLNWLIETCHAMRAAVQDLVKARTAYRRALQEYIGSNLK